MLASASEKKNRKNERIRFLKEEVFQDAKAVVLADFKGLDMKETKDLRKGCLEKEVDFKVVKNSLVRIASKGTDYEDLFKSLVGNTAIAFSKEDPGVVAKVISEYAEKNKKLSIKGGALPNKVLSEQEIENLAKLPSKEELYAKLLATMNGVPTNFVRLLNEVPASFLRLLVAYKNSKEQAE